MSDLTTTATEHQFYNELIDRFFHPKSYFFYCIRKYLENPLLFTDNPNFSITQIISLLIEYLSKSKQPAQDLNEITKIKNFEHLLLNLETKLIRYDLKVLDQPQLKKAIQNIALYFLRYIFQVLLEHEKAQNTLINYLEIKMKLIELLNGSNGKHKNTSKSDDSIEIETSGISKKRLIDPIVENNSGILSVKDQPSDSFNLLDNYFEKEVSRLLKPLAIFSNKKSEFYANSDFIKQVYENFSQIQELAIYHGYEEIEVIAERVTQLMKTLLSTKNTIKQSIIGLIYDAKAAVEKYLFHHQNLDNLKDFLDTFDLFTSELSKSDETKEDLTEEHHSLPDLESDRIGGFEINTSFNKFRDSSRKSTQHDNKSSIFSGFLIEKNDSEKVDTLKFPGEDDEELLKLINEITIPIESSLPKDFFTFHNDEAITNGESKNIPTDEAIINVDSQHIPTDEAIKNVESQHIPTENNILQENVMDESDNLEAAIPEHEEIPNTELQGSKSEENVAQEDQYDDNLNNFDASTNQTFQQEAVLYYKILLNAISQLKSEEKVQTALEDIELASSSLKYLAQKFGMERLALLPELVESISIVTNEHLIKLPDSILQGMEDGINLLKGFEVNNKDHKKTFMSILALLKEFCTKTLNMTNKIQITC